MQNINNKIATLAAGVSLGLGSAKGIGKDTEFLKSNAAPASTLITTPTEKELTPAQELRRAQKEELKKLLDKQQEETQAVKDKEKGIISSAQALDKELTLKAGAKALSTGDIEKFLKAANLDDKITPKYLQDNLGKDVKAAMLETEGVEPEQKKKLISKLYSESDLKAAERVKEKFAALTADGADLKAGLNGLLKSWQPSSPSVVAALLKHHLGVEDSPKKMLAKVYSQGENAKTIEADPKLLNAFKSLENSFR